MSEVSPDIAVIIPTLNEADEIGTLLTDLTARGFSEIIVADGGSGDGTCAIASSYAHVRVISAPAGRGPQIAAGIEASQASVLIILHADTRLPADAADRIVEVLGQTGVAGGCFRLRFREPRLRLRVAEWFTRFESRWTTFGDQAFFFNRRTLEQIGGVPLVPFLEDVILRQRLLRAGRFVKVPSPVVTSGRRLIASGVIRGQLRNAAIMVAFSLGHTPDALARHYRPRLAEVKGRHAWQALARPKSVWRR